MKDKTFFILLTVIWLSMGGVYLLAADAKQELIELFSQHDINLISKPVERIRLNPFNVF